MLVGVKEASDGASEQGKTLTSATAERIGCVFKRCTRNSPGSVNTAAPPSPQQSGGTESNDANAAAGGASPGASAVGAGAVGAGAGDEPNNSTPAGSDHPMPPFIIDGISVM